MGVEQLGRYTVLKHLASGGMADVLLARSDGIENFERHVVLKRIRAEHATDKRFITMFLDEARIAATLHHQNVVQVFDVGEDTGGYFFAMEYIHGEDLRRLLSAVSKTKGHMPLGHMIAIVSAVAAGLHYAHERRSNDKKALSIVHRDVSPSNVIVGFDGSVKVLDFGIAKARTRHAQTSGGSMKGKVSYMSPEQCKGESIDRRSDVFALGIVLYELATTTRLFKGDSDYVVMDAIVTGKVPMPRVRRPDLPNELAQIIMKALAPDPARRYQTADELRLALEQFALAMNLTSSTSGLASYMRKLFGEKPEPWLVDDAPTKSGASLVDAGRTSSHNSWTEEVAAVTGETARTSASAITPRDTRTSMKLGWEQGRVTGASGGKKLLWFSIPVVLALGGIGVWQFVVKPRTDKAEATQPAPAQQVAAQPAPVAAVAAPTPPPAAAPVEPEPAAPADTAAEPT
ncbi:MAG: serine/threonine protein kinase, partial [Kofleriaceae bacterium]|nr:serine/threonine protein kinase [Kofleriaceae bacterium]